MRMTKVEDLNKIWRVGSMLLLAAASLLMPPDLSAAAAQKADPWVLRTAASGETELLVVLSEQADLSAASSLRGKDERGRFVFERLTATARATQGPLLDELDRLGVEYKPFWIVNMIWVRGGLEVVEAMAKRPEVARLDANPRVAFDGSVGSEPAPRGPGGVEWNIALVNADDVWALGFTGQDVVIGGQDTGYDWEHPALQRQYRGWNGSSADHDYNWHDAIHSGGGSCGPDSSEPCDDNDHGTHTMGTMVGDDGGGNQIGMAPGARWIGCRNMDEGTGTPATYTECFQWFVAPTDLDDQNPDPAKAPHVINNSWTCPPSEGCAHGTLRQVVENTRAAGIAVVVAAGNGGPSCSTVSSPPAIYEAAFSVGATSSFDTIASFSSRGPVAVDESGRLKPDVSAPGFDVRSSVRGGGYDSSNGTSMASPHVAGLVALAISIDPSLAGDVDQLEALIEQTAVPRTTTESCGGVPGDEVPNNTYGWGRIDALALADLLVDRAILAFTPPALDFGDIEVDSTNAPRIATLHNDGNLAATELTFDGLPDAGFEVDTSDCGIALEPKESCEVSVTFTPSELGAATAALQANSLEGAAASLALEGNGVAPAAVASPTGLQVDPVSGTSDGHAKRSRYRNGGIGTGGNGVFEPGELVEVAPAWRNDDTFAAELSGTADGFDGPPGAVYSLVNDTAAYGVVEPGATSSCLDVEDCYQMGLNDPPRPATHWEATFEETLPGGATKTWTLHIGDSFTDVAPTSLFYRWIETLLHHQVTDGCTDTRYCPASANTRGQMAVFLLRASEGGDYAPPPCVDGDEVFEDVPFSSPFCPWIEDLVVHGVTSGCGGSDYCPGDSVSRGQMAVFLLRTLLGSEYEPPTCSGVFDDVACPSLFADWVEDLVVRGVTSGCGGSDYCPGDSVSRGQMAVFLAKTFGLTLYGP